METVTLEVCEPDNREICAFLVGDIRTIYHAGMQRIRYARREGSDVPYMKCSDKRLNFWLTCCRMSVTYGFDI